MIYLNSSEITFDRFPNGETKLDAVTVDETLYTTDESTNVINLRYEDDSDLIKLLFLKKYIDNKLKKGSTVRLLIQYMPYSRMDRAMGGAAFTLQYVTDFINALDFDRVTVAEPHSDVTTALLNRSDAFMATQFLLPRVMRQIDFDSDSDYLFYPDAGAQKRYAEMAGAAHLVGYKHRDVTTGRITDLQLVGEPPAHPSKIIIVDDLSSYGGTFLLSATKLREAGFKEIYLLVTHAENSIFKGKLFETDLIDKIFTTDSLLDASQRTPAAADRLHVFPMNQLM